MKRLKKILKWTGIVLGGLVAIVLIANAIFVSTTDTRLEKQLAAIRAAGDPLTLADLARAPIPPEKNAATYLRRAEADMTAIEKETMNLRRGSFLLPVEDQKTVKAVLAAYPNVIPLLEQAAACPDYDVGLDYTLSAQEFQEKLVDVVSKARSPARVLHYRARLLVAEGNCDEAVRTSLLIFRLARHCDRNPTVIGYLVAIAVRGIAIGSANTALQTGPVSQEVRDALDAALAIQECMDGFVRALKSERACALASFNDIIPGRNCWFFARGYWNMQESACLDEMRAFLTLTHESMPYQQADQTIRRVQAETQSVLGQAFAQQVGVGMQSVQQAVTRVRAMIRSLRVLNALQTHVPAESNEVPKLTELGLPAETITDPFTGEPLHVKKTPRGWLVYSVGRNLQDDGGNFDDPRKNDDGVGPPPPVAKPEGKEQEHKAETKE